MQIGGKFNSLRYNPNHPFKVGIMSILMQHFAPSITKNFSFILELEKFILDEKRTPNLIRQKNDQNFVCEVYYTNPSGLMEFVCDLYSWETKGRTEAHLLRMITDKYKTGVIGKDWFEKDGQLSADVTSGKYETPDSELEKGTVEYEMKGGKK